MISNALKFTFKGHIGVYLTLLDDEEEVVKSQAYGE
jgi:hypothetical protein